MHVCDFAYTSRPALFHTHAQAHAWTISKPHLPEENAGPDVFTKSATVQDAFWPPGLISCTGVTGRWALLSKCSQVDGLIHMTCVGIRIPTVVSLCATVTYNYVPAWGRSSKLQKLPMIHNRMKLLPLCYAASDTACIRTSPDGFSWSKDPAEWREMA